MTIAEIRDADDCVEGSFMKEILLTEPIKRELIDYLGTFGDLQYFPNFARPFFRVDVPGKFIVKGIEGDRRLSAVLSREHTSEALNLLVDIIASCQMSRAGR
jgi:hypothetical protein